MTCYKDKTYCAAWLICKNGHTCDRALTDTIQSEARAANMLISQVNQFPDCFIPWFEKGETNE